MATEEKFDRIDASSQTRVAKLIEEFHQINIVEAQGLLLTLNRSLDGFRNKHNKWARKR